MHVGYGFVQKQSRVKYESKFAAAKKVLKKQLKVNTKVVFDDDGLVCLIYREVLTGIITYYLSYFKILHFYSLLFVAALFVHVGVTEILFFRFVAVGILMMFDTLRNL